MKKFERYIIYPMLFIAIFFNFVDDGVQQTTAKEIIDNLIVKSIKVVNDKGEPQIYIDGNSPMPSISLRSSYDLHKDNNIFISSYGINISGKSYVNELSTFSMKIKEKKENSSIFDNGFLYIGADNNKDHGGVINLFNENEDEKISLSTDNHGHGLIRVYDKYGEYFRNYTYK